VSRKGGTGGGEQIDAPKGFKQMTVPALDGTKAFVAQGVGLSLLFSNNFWNNRQYWE